MFTVGKKMEILYNKNVFMYTGDMMFLKDFLVCSIQKNFKKHLIFGFEANIL